MLGKNSKENRDNLVDYYDGYVERQKKIGVNERHFSILEKMKESGLCSNHKVLEIGCGIGTFTSLLIKSLSHGQLVSIDISGNNIKEAKKTLGHYENLSLVHADAVQYSFDNDQFDIVVLPDVIEHIPIEEHSTLFRKIKDILTPKGIVFIHIPNPEYLEWCHINRPDLLQIIDQPIYPNLLIQNTLQNDLIITKLETYCVWVVDGDYQFIVLRKKGYENYENIIEKKITLIDKIKYKLMNAKK